MNEQSLNIKFVQEVEKYPCLYNYKLTDYSRKDVTERAWCAVGKIFNLTEGQSKEKWKNLRAVFVRHLKTAPSGSPSKNKKPYYLADAMHFTIPYIKALKTNISGNLPQEAIKEVMEQEDNEETNESQSLLQQAPSPNPPDLQIIPSPMSCPLPASSPISNQPISPMSCPSPRPTAHGTDLRSNRRKRQPHSTVDEGIMDYFKARKAKLQKNTEDIEDPKRMFLLSLLPDIKAMSESQTRTFKRRVLALVDEILEESPKPLSPPQPATPAYNVETQGVFISTQESSVSNEQRATQADNETQGVLLSPQGPTSPNEYNHILSYYESIPFIINKNNN